MIHLSLLQTMMDEGYVIRQKHPTADLWIYNYTPAAQYERVWNKITLLCRGLIMDKNHQIIARPLPKFFNLGEISVEDIPNESFDLFEKMDGSLGILYFLDGLPFIASRGSFNSIQSKTANRILYQKYRATFELLNPNYTYIFEIIYPENRIVVNYGATEEIYLLAIVETNSGKDIPLTDIGFPIVKKYEGNFNLFDLQQLEQENKEGFVVKFENGYRIKVKFAEYTRLHYIMANVSNKSIWELLLQNKPLNELIHFVPDEFYDWVKKTENDLRLAYEAIETIAKLEFKKLEDRKTTAEYYKTCTYPGILFSMLDGKNYAPKIWRMVQPKFEKPFLHQMNE